MALPQGAYNHKDHEAEILKRWLESGAYKPNSDPKIENSENWTLICPPPNAYGRPHVGNISGYAYIDAMARIQRMKGKNVLVIPGKDHAGLEGEGVFVREVLEKQGKKKFDMKREDFYAEMMEFFMKNMKQGREDEQNIGLSADFDLDTFTLDPEIVDTVLDTFIEMYQKGMIYKGVRIVNWDPKARTAVADNQVIYEDAVTPFYYFKYSFGDPDPKALELKNQFKGKEIEWVFERNKTKDEKSHLPFAFGYLAEPPLREADLQLQIKEGGFSHNHYNAKLKDFARANRKQQTKGEAILWSKLRNKQFLGLKFLRQRPIDNYIADFLQPDLKLIIEIGMSHDDKKYDYDTHRENKLKQLGFSVLRFSEFDVKTKLDEVLQTIANFFDKNSTPPAPSQEGHIPIEIIGVGYDTEIKSGDKLKGKVVGILMRMNAPHRLVVVNDQSGVNVGKEYILSLQNEFQRIFEFESKHYAGAHIILFNQYPDDKFYTNGFIIGTVRPETIFADTAIACSPDDERYKDFVGKEVEVEFLGIKKKLNFISDYSVLPDFGTGLLKITPAHANEDWEIAQRHPKECLPAIQVIGYDLKMNSLTGKYEGMKIKEAREAMEEDMIKHGNLIHVDREYKNKVAIAERTKAPIEPLLSSQWYLSYDVPVGDEGKTLRRAALEMVNGKGFTADAHSVETQDFASLQQEIASSSGEIKILPPSMIGKFNNWMNHLRDWAISRSLWWGYRLPVWYHGEVKEEIGADGQVRELIKLSNSISNNIQIDIAKVEDAETIHRISVDGWHDNFVNEAVGFTLEKMQSEFGKKYGNQEAINNIKNGIKDESTKYFIAKSEGKVVGWVSVDNINKEDTNWLDIYVDRNYRGKGLGKQLLNYAIKNITEVVRFDIAVPENSPAVEFYKKFGFVEYDRNDKNEYGFPVIQMKFYSEDFNTFKKVILVDAVRTIISANENYDLESFSLNKELADYLAEQEARIVVVTNATNDGNLEKITELLKDYNFEIFTLHKNPLKTQSEYFTKLAEELSINLNNAIYFDHKQENIDSAIKAGLKQTKLYTQDNESIKGWIQSCNESRASLTPNPSPSIDGEGNFLVKENLRKRWRNSKGYLYKFANELRKDMTESEKILWEALRKSEYKFRRQHALEMYIADFYCAEFNLLVEVDGGIHEFTKEEDKLRDEYLASLGYKTIRFTNDDIKSNLNEVIRKINEIISELKSPLSKNSWRGVGGEEWLPLEYNNPNHILVQKQSPGEGWFQDENVLDTWFSSAQWPFATLTKYGLMHERYPTDVMLSGFDILENWDSRMMMFSYFKTGKVPFKTLYLTGLVKGTDGQKMSKSKGNVVSMDEIREKYGTDAVRMVYYYQNTAGADYAMTYEKLETFKRFANKIWNASKFVLMNIVENIDTNVNSLKLEELKLKENIELFKFITEAKEHITKNIDEYEFGLATFNLYQYFWHDFADVHIEAVKKYVLSQRDKTTNEVIHEPNAEEKAETTRVLLFTLKSFIKMLHPFMPFITQRIWDEVPKEEGENEFVMYSRW